MARDEIDSVIQTLVRWKTPEAMKIYARMSPEEYANYVDLAASADTPTDGEAPTNLTEIDPEDLMADTEAAIAALDLEERASTKAARDQRAAPNVGGVNAAESSGAAGKRRRTAPATGCPSADAAEHAACERRYDIGDGASIAHRGDESWRVVGEQLRMHHSFWPGYETPEGERPFSTCRVVAYAGAFTFSSGKRSKHTYVIECEGYYYPACHTAVAGAIADDAVKRRVRKAGNPKLT